MTENNMAADAASPSVIELLRRGREKIAAGWVGHAPRARGEDCALTALGLPSSREQQTAKWVLRLAIGIEQGELSGWNDAPGRTKEEVLAAFDKAIALSEGNATPKAEP